MHDVGAVERVAEQKSLDAEQRTPTRSGTGVRDSAPAETSDPAQAPAGAADPAKAGVPASIRNVGAGVAVLLALRFVLPRLLRRL